jgi:hypothetical protein
VTFVSAASHASPAGPRPTRSSAPHRATRRALDRLLRLALWIRERTEPFSFQDARVALPDAYRGSSAAAERAWSRDKLRLATVGVRLASPWPGAYVLDGRCLARRLDLARDPALADAVRALPRGGAAVETALRKLLVAGAPLRRALLDRETFLAASSRPPPRADLPALLASALALANLVLAAGDDGLTLSEAAGLCGAAGAGELGRVLEVVTGVSLTWAAPPFDETGIALANDRVCAFMRHLRPTRLALTRSEHAAVVDAASTLAAAPGDALVRAAAHASGATATGAPARDAGRCLDARASASAA